LLDQGYKPKIEEDETVDHPGILEVKAKGIEILCLVRLPVVQIGGGTPENDTY
jgi:hypothetical protein